MPKNNYDNNYFDAVFKSIFEDIKSLVHSISDIEDKYVTQKEFQPVKNFVYGMVALMATTIGAALIGLIIKK